MNEIKIYLFKNYCSEYESSQRGYMFHVYVRINDTYYELNIYTLLSLSQEFSGDYETLGFHDILHNIILVNDISYVEVKNTIYELYKRAYFEEIKPISKVDIESIGGEIVEI